MALTRSFLAGCALALASLSALAQSGPAVPVSVPISVPIGGGLKNDHDAVWQRLVALAGGAGSRWVVLGTASESPMSSAEAAAAQLRRRGAVAEVLPVSPLLKDRPVAEVVKDPALVAQVQRASGVFFTGGSQDRITGSLAPAGQETPLLAAIRALHARGGVVAGTSAGAAVMSRTMFVDAPDVLAVLKGRYTMGVEVGPGLGFVGDRLFVDQHFFKRGRLARMLPVMQAAGYTLGLGVEENAACAVRGDEIEVLGGSALFVDLADAQQDRVDGAYRLRGARVSRLEAGDRLNIATRVLTPAAAKAGQVYDPASPAYKPYYTLQPFHVDMLGDGVLPTAMGLLIDATYAEVRGLAFDPRARADDPLGALGWELRLYKAPGSIGWYSEAAGGEDYTVHRLGLDLLPVRMAQPLYVPWPAPAR